MAYNEEPNIEAALNSVQRAMEGLVDDYEVVVIDDGSTDRTGELIRRRAETDPRIRLISHDGNKGYGVAFQSGLQHAVKEYVTAFAGDNEMAAESLHDIVKARGQADLVISFPQGGHKRSVFRRVISRTYVVILNLLFGQKLRYYNGPFVYRTALVREITVRSTGFSAVSECLVKLLKKGYHYRELPFITRERLGERSKALSVKSLFLVVTSVLALAGEIYFPRSEEKRS